MLFHSLYFEDTIIILQVPIEGWTKDERRMIEGWLGNNVTINSVLVYIYCNVVIVMLCPNVMCNACAVLVLCFDYIHSFIVKFVLNPKRINTTLSNFLYICNINACSKSTSVNNMQFLARCERKWHTIPIILQQIRFYQSNGIMHIWHWIKPTSLCG